MKNEHCLIMVVDDDPFVADMLAMILSGEGFAVATAANGPDALAALEGAPETGLVISDMNMPGMNGLELIAAIRQQHADLPIIILTGNNEISVAIAAMTGGASDYLLKDENIHETILFSVAKVLEKHTLKMQNRQLMEDISRKNRQMEEEREIARMVQENILPHQLSLPGFNCATCYQASNQIGGDFFDAFETEGHIHFLIGDISGHCTSSALVMAVCKGMFLSLGQSMTDLLAIVTAANRMLCQMLSQSGMFLTLVYAMYAKESGTLAIVSAGHNSVYLLDNARLTSIDSSGPVLGWDPEDSWELMTYPFAPGATLFLYTDGLVEARSQTGDEYGNQLLAKLTATSAPPHELVAGILSDLTDFCGNRLEDDLTMFAVQRQP